MRYRLFTAAFLAACLFPSVGMLFAPQEQTTAAERLSPKPSLFTEEGGWNAAVLEQTADYVADHFAFRQTLVTANAALRVGLLYSSPEEDVIAGKDGWLYYAKTLDDYQNRATLTDAQAEQLARTVAEMQAYCQARGARFLFTVAPNKNSVYPAQMPARYLQSGQAGNYERVLPYLQQYGVHYADLFALFAAQDETLYYQTDSHWTNRGAALVHDALMDALGLPHTTYADAPYTETETHRGDLYAMLYPAGTRRESEQQYQTAFTHVREPRSAEDILIETTAADAPNGRLLFCRDSFGNALYPFLAGDFAQATVTRQQPYPLDDVQAGDTVIIEIAERNLTKLLEYTPDLGNKSEMLSSNIAEE